MPNGRKVPYLCEGIVTRRDDPEGWGRIKLRIPGLIEPETPDWVYPIGASGSGGPQHGTFDPPIVDSTVDVLFKMGDIRHPRYITGPWGAPGGVSDVPTNAAIDGDTGEPDKRQNVVTEDEEWRIERDSRSESGAEKRYLIRHKNSSLAVLIDGSNDKVYLVRENATQALVRGTEYRAAEVTYLGALHVALLTFAGTVASAVTVAQIAAAASTLQVALNAITETDIRNDATAYISEKAFTE